MFSKDFSLRKLKSQGLCGEGLKDNTLSNHPYTIFSSSFHNHVYENWGGGERGGNGANR